MSGIQYRPDIDGLRAIAVLAVVQLSATVMSVSRNRQTRCGDARWFLGDGEANPAC